MALFEYYCYITLVAHVYDKEFDHNYEITDIKKFEATKLIKFLKTYFNKPNTSLENKSKMVYKFIKDKNVDVLFIQEGGSINWKGDSDYEIQQREGSIIIFKKQIFGSPIKQMQTKFEN